MADTPAIDSRPMTDTERRKLARLRTAWESVSSEWGQLQKKWNALLQYVDALEAKYSKPRAVLVEVGVLSAKEPMFLTPGQERAWARSLGVKG